MKAAVNWLWITAITDAEGFIIKGNHKEKEADRSFFCLAGKKGIEEFITQAVAKKSHLAQYFNN